MGTVSGRWKVNTQLRPEWSSTPPAFLDNSQLKRIPRTSNSTSGFHPDIKSGFHPAVFIQTINHRYPEALKHMRCNANSRVLELPLLERLLLISFSKSVLEVPIKHKKINRVKPEKEDLLQNRKTPSYKDTVVHNGTTYEILAGENYGIYLSIVHKMIDQLEICQEKWGRVFAVRLEPRQDYYRGDNKLMSRFICNFKKKILIKYGIREMGFQWCREIETAKQQHYHVVVFLDGYKVNSAWSIHRIGKEVWERIHSGNHMSYVKNRSSYDVRKGDELTKRALIKRVSYLAKTRGKSYRDPQAKDYSSSRLTRVVRLSQ